MALAFSANTWDAASTRDRRHRTSSSAMSLLSPLPASSLPTGPLWGPVRGESKMLEGNRCRCHPTCPRRNSETPPAATNSDAERSAMISLKSSSPVNSASLKCHSICSHVPPLRWSCQCDGETGDHLYCNNIEITALTGPRTWRALSVLASACILLTMVGQTLATDVLVPPAEVRSLNHSLKHSLLNLTAGS